MAGPDPPTIENDMSHRLVFTTVHGGAQVVGHTAQTCVTVHLRCAITTPEQLRSKARPCTAAMSATISQACSRQGVGNCWQSNTVESYAVAYTPCTPPLLV